MIEKHHTEKCHPTADSKPQGDSLAEAQRIAVEHPGELIAWNFDGTHVYGIAKTIDQLQQLISQQGLELSDVVVGWVSGSETQLGAGLTD